MSVAWSFSALKSFTNCPRRYNEVNRLKNYKDQGFTASTGVDIHSHLELAVKENRPIPAPYQHYQGMIDVLKLMPGDKLPEHQMTFTSNMQTTTWFAKDAWLRYAADLLIVDRDAAVAHLVDYKSGKSKYADTEQLKLGALCVFATEPKVAKVRGALIFTGEERLIKATYVRAEVPRYWEPFMVTYNQLIKAVDVDSFAPKTSGLCKTCPVETCEYHKG
jgi:hypothetical protein